MPNSFNKEEKIISIPADELLKLMEKEEVSVAEEEQGEKKEKESLESKKEEVKTIIANLKQAWQAGADKNCIAWGLAGVGNPESMKLRNDLWKAGADKDYIAWGLAGVNTKKAEEFRVKHFKNKPNLIAKSYTTNRIACNGVICRYGYEK